MITSVIRRSPARLALVVLVALAVVAGATVSAFAYFTSSGSGGASVQTGTLNPPTAVTASSTAGTGAVSVSWTAPVAGVAPLGYYVTRSGAAACASSASSLVSSTSCSDPSVPVGTYTYTVVAVFRSWTATSSASAAVTVAQAPQAITFTSSPVNPTYGGTYTVTATGGGSGKPVVFSSATTSVCTVSGPTVSFVGAGGCTVNADQAGSTYYSAAPTVAQSFAVARAAQTISFTSTAPANAVVAGATYTVAASGGASGSSVVFSIDAASNGACTITGAVVSFAHVGTCVIDANQAGNANYLPAGQVQQSVAVGKGAQAISITSTLPSSAKVGGSYVPAATANSGLTVAITLDAASTGCTLSGGTVSFAGAGTCKVDFNQSGNSDYTAAGQMQQSFDITRIDQTIQGFTVPSSAVYVTGGTGTGSASATASSGLTVTFTSSTPAVCTVSGTTITYVAAGTCTISAAQAGNFQYNAAPAVTPLSFTIAPASQTIAFTSTKPSAATVGTTYTAAATASSGLTVAFSSGSTSICTSSGTNGATFTFVGVGTCIVNADQAGNGNYNAAARVQQSFAVAGVTPTIASVNPTALTRSSTTTVTVTGTGFQVGIRASLDDSTYVIQSVTYVSPTQITLSIKDNYANAAAGKANLTLTNPDNSSVTKNNAISNS